ncbi:MAG: TetR/AcrR family transcriptional regulator [Candidatus Competibacteraceae bacterium]
MAITRQPLRKGTGKVGYHHGNLRAALVEAGLQLVEETGIEALTLREAARRAGVSQTAPYRHFADKEALLAAVAAAGFKALQQALSEAATGIGDINRRLPRLGQAYVHFALDHPGLFRLMFGAGIGDKQPYPLLQQAAQAAYALLEDTMRAYLSGGHDIPAATVAAWSLVHGLASLLLDRQFDSIEMTGELRNLDKYGLVQQITDLFVTAIGLARRAPAR